MTDIVQKLVGALKNFTDGCSTSIDAYAVARAALSEAKAGGWQPIETAPKDGTEVFVYVPGDSLFPTAAAYKSADYFEKEYGDRDYMEEGWYWAFGYPSDFHECVITPTAWQPLPNPPKEQSAGGLGSVDAVANPLSPT